MNINFSHYHLKTDLLGPYQRSVLWVQGCLKNCKGCIAPATHSTQERFLLDSGILASLFILQSETEGITISGGEPFLQCKALTEMLLAIKKERKDYGVIVYTGQNYTDILKNLDTDIQNFLKQIDLLIDGEYQETLADDRFAVGSSNQHIIQLSDRYDDDVIQDFYYCHSEKNQKIEIQVEGNSFVSMTGVPSKESGELWQKIKTNLKKI